MKVILKDGTELECIQVNGGDRHFQGNQRDSLEFSFSPQNHNYEEVRNTFVSTTAIQEITLNDGTNSYTHFDYSLVVEVKEYPFETKPVTTTPPEFENRISVVLCQLTYSEKQQEKLRADTDYLLMLNGEV